MILGGQCNRMMAVHTPNNFYKAAKPLWGSLVNCPVLHPGFQQLSGPSSSQFYEGPIPTSCDTHLWTYSKEWRYSSPQATSKVICTRFLGSMLHNNMHMVTIVTGINSRFSPEIIFLTDFCEERFQVSVEWKLHHQLVRKCLGYYSQHSAYSGVLEIPWWHNIVNVVRILAVAATYLSVSTSYRNLWKSPTSNVYQNCTYHLVVWCVLVSELALIRARMSCPFGSFISASYREPNSPLPSLLEIRMVSAGISHLLAK